MQKYNNIIAVSSLGYPEIRNISSLPFKNYKVVKVQNLYKILSVIFFKIFNKTHSYFWNSFTDFGVEKVDLVHLFNGICWGITPWVSTFETTLPRWGDVSKKTLKKGIYRIADDRCLAIIALSNCTKNIQLSFINENHPELFDVINRKLHVIHPPQKCFFNSYDEKQLPTEEIHFLFLGNQFFSKGGREVVKTLKKIRKNHTLRLTIISNFSKDDYATNSKESDVLEVKQDLKKNKDWITVKTNISNKDVIDLLRVSHVSLMPTYADTYGYFVLESKASGCPTVTTDIRSLPEINNNESGWIIKVPKNKFGNGLLNTVSERRTFSEILEVELVKVLTQIVQSPQIIRIKGDRAIQEIIQNHDPETIANEIESKIYSKVKT